MSTLWIVVAVLAAPPAAGDAATSVQPSPAAAEQRPVVPPRTGIELRDAVRAALKRFARPEDKEADLAARQFMVLYRELQADTKMVPSQRQGYRNKVRGRLMALARQIEKRVAIQKRLAKTKRPASVEAAKQDDVLAQWGAFGGQGFGGRGFGGQGFGGPGVGGPMMGGGRFGGQANNDNGQQLVELIQQTIAPESWDVNGGPGSIYYWQRNHALIIRQTGEVHEQIGDVLQQMGKLGP